MVTKVAARRMLVLGSLFRADGRHTSRWKERAMNFVSDRPTSRQYWLEELPRTSTQKIQLVT
jgi:hypothetical protein